jgi:hypothetical protein
MPIPRSSLRRRPASFAHLLADTKVLWRFTTAVGRREAEAVSKWLAYEFGGDRNCWPVTQMLRLPGTINHKPEYERPRVLLIKQIGQPYARRPDVTPLAQTSLKTFDVDPQRHDRDEVIARYAPQLARDVVRLMKDKWVLSGTDRSDMIFKIIVELYEVGATPNEIASVVWGSVYFTSKHGQSLSRLNGEIRRIIGKQEAKRARG